MDENSPEVLIAIRAAIMASELCQRIRKELSGGESILKDDRSPVTIADFGSQAIICKLIKEKFPDDVIVAEEDSTELRKPSRSKILERVAHYVKSLIPEASIEKVFSWIDHSSHRLGERFWTVDPIDGTKGFLRGDQYAIAIALIEDRAVRLGLMACPNLYVEKDQPQGKRGCLFLAIKGKGSFQMDLQGESKEPLSVSKTNIPSQALFTESVEPDHADHLFHQRVAKKLGIKTPPLKMDSQAKYAIVARGETTLYLRVPSPLGPGYKENIWDHAAGSIMAEEAGGRVTDIFGHPLDFSSGIKMEKNHGVLVTNGILHEVVLNALKI